jgi:periplasmic copper chaperone A
MEEPLFKVRFLVVFSALAAILLACAPADGHLQVSDTWARPGLAGGNSAVYFVIHNETAGTDTLLSASSDVAGAVELHMTSMQNGNMQMMHQQEVPLPTGKTEFKPGGLHVMLIGLNQDLNPGDMFSLTLDFATAGVIPLEVTVSEP